MPTHRTSDQRLPYSSTKIEHSTLLERVIPNKTISAERRQQEFNDDCERQRGFWDTKKKQQAFPNFLSLRINKCTIMNVQCVAKAQTNTQSEREIKWFRCTMTSSSARRQGSLNCERKRDDYTRKIVGAYVVTAQFKMVGMVTMFCRINL